ncbi:IS66 family transposase [Ectobacillus sp. JY-23]|nr:IS66 family transposase [Ectobacillus sp. JY-23]
MKTGRQSGGQPGHTGHTLRMTDHPDHRCVHPVTTCAGCGTSFKDVPPKRHIIRQVFDIPPLSIEVTQHEAEVKSCPCCRSLQEAEFPAHVKRPVQYGPRLRALGAYLTQYQLIPYERTAELIADLFGHTVSEGTLVTINRQMGKALETVEQDIYRHLLSSPILHMDETGMRVEGKRQWLHVASNAKASLYMIHPKRGKEAMDAMKVLPQYRGVSIHDGWPSYFRYDTCAHALCNAHHLRELRGIWENTKQLWAQDMMDVLLWMKEERETTSESLPPDRMAHWERVYKRILQRGFAQNPAPPTTKKKGKPKQSAARNLLHRLSVYQDSVLMFLRNASVPFDNNQAERDIRMAKVKENISGTFRNEQDGKVFCRIRSFISTIKKQKRSVLFSLGHIIEGKPVDLFAT